MAVIESPPEVATEGATAVPDRQSTGLAGFLGSGDHKVIGRAYIVMSLVFGLAAAVTGELVAVERIDTSRLNVLSVDTQFQVFTFHSVSATFLFLLPLILGLAFVVVPLQVGAPTIAFPRAAAASFWAWLISGGLVVTSYLINGGPQGGRSRGVDLWIVALAALLAALVLGSACLIATVLGLRAPGMNLGRVPMFAWSMLVAGTMWLLTLPVLVGVLVLMYEDHKHGRVTFGESSGMYDRIVWAFRHPQVYAFAVPVLGIAGDVLAVTTRSRQAFRGVAMGAIAAFGAFGFGAFVQLSVYGDAVKQPAYIGISLLAVTPVLLLLALWADLFRRGGFSFSAPLLFAVAAVLMLLVGVLAGAAGAIPALKVANTEWDAAVTHYATLGAVIAVLGGLYWWATKVIGRPAGQALGGFAALSLLLGTVLLAFPNLISAFLRAHSKSTKKGVFQALAIVEVVGGGLIAVGVVVAAVNLLGAMRRRSDGGDGRDEVPSDPWQGHTLEWATLSPPPLHNFSSLPVVSSPEPMLDQREEASA